MSACCSAALSRVCTVQHPVEPADLLPGQKPRESTCLGDSFSIVDAPRRVGFEVTAGDGEVHDAAEEIERVIGVAGGGPAEAVEPAPDLLGHDAVERLRAEGRHELAVEHGPDALSRGRLVSLEMGFLPRALDEVPEQRSRAPGRAGRFRFRLARMAFPAGLRDGLQGHRAKRDPPRAPAGILQQDIAPPAGGPDPDAEAGDMIIPDRVFPAFGGGDGRWRRR